MPANESSVRCETLTAKNYCRSVVYDDANGVALYFGGEFAEGVVRRWKVPEFEPLDRLENLQTVFGFSPGGLYVGFGRQVCAVNPQTDAVVWEAGVECLACVVDSTRGVVAVVRRDRSISLLTADTGRLIATLPPHPSRVASLSTATDGSLCVVGYGGEVLLWHLDTGAPAGRLTAGFEDVCAGCVNADGSAVAVVGPHKLEVWETQTSQAVATRVPKYQSFSGVQSARVGNRFAVGEVRKEANPKYTSESWNQPQWIETGSVFLLGGPGFDVTAELNRPRAAFSPDGASAVGYRSRHPRDRDVGDFSLKVWRPDGEPVVLECEDPVWSAAVSNDGRFVFSAEMSYARVWDLRAECPG